MTILAQFRDLGRAIASRGYKTVKKIAGLFAVAAFSLCVFTAQPVQASPLAVQGAVSAPPAHTTTASQENVWDHMVVPDKHFQKPISNLNEIPDFHLHLHKGKDDKRQHVQKIADRTLGDKVVIVNKEGDGVQILKDGGLTGSVNPKGVIVKSESPGNAKAPIYSLQVGKSGYTQVSIRYIL